MPQIVIDIIKYIFIGLLILLIGYTLYYIFIRRKCSQIEKITLPIVVYVSWNPFLKPETKTYEINNKEIVELNYNRIEPIKYLIRYNMILSDPKDIVEFMTAKVKDIGKFLRLKITQDDEFLDVVIMLTDKRTKQTGTEILGDMVIDYDTTQMIVDFKE